MYSKKLFFLTLKITVKKDKVGGLTLPTFKTHYIAIIIQKSDIGKQISRARKQNKEPKNRPMKIQSTDLSQRIKCSSVTIG